MPRVSILIPLYNAEKFIAQTIESVLNQTFEDWELIVLDDCSTDNSFQIAQIFEQKDKRITVKKNTQNLGMMGNWNEGIKYCHSEYFVKLDADDIWHPEMLGKSVDILDTMPNVGMVFTKYINIDENSAIIPNTEITLPDFAKDKAFSCVPLVQSGVDKMLSYSILRQGLSVMRYKIFDKIGAYRYLLSQATQASTDTEFYFRVGCHEDIYCIDNVLYQYRIHQKSISQTDITSNLASQKIYETKYSILTYYYEQQKINYTFLKKNITKIKLQYNFESAYQYRKQKRYRNAIHLMFKNFLIHPLKTIQFYIGRI